MSITDPIIETPKRVRILIESAKIVGFEPTDLPMLVLDTLEAVGDGELFEIDSMIPDYAESRQFMMRLIRSFTGSDDDYDDLSHELDHALDTTEHCPAHDAECAACCEDCMDE